MANDIVITPAQESTQETKAEKKRRKKIPGIYQRGNRWQIDTFYKGIRLRDNCATPEMAEANLRKMKTLIDEGRYLDKKHESSETLGQFKKRYLEWCEDIRQKTAYDKGVYFRPILAHFGEDTLLARITRAQIEEYQAKRLSTPGERRKHIKPATVNREIATLKHLYSKAVEWKVIEENPARGVKMLKENNRRLRFLTVEECKILLDACPSTTLRQVVELALNTGMRKSELLQLERDHVNLRQGFVEILDQKNGEYDTIPLNERAIEILRSIPLRLDSKYVFTGQKPGKPFYDLKGQFEKAVKAAGLEDVTFHTLRHTAASHMVMVGVDLSTVQAILRHKSIAMTQRYAHLSPAHKKGAVEALGKSLKGESGKTEKTA